VGNEGRASAVRGRKGKLACGGINKGKKQRGKKLVDGGRARFLI